MEIKSDVNELQKPTWPPGAPCQCKKVLKYIQPEIAKSFKPDLKYNKAPVPVSGDTIYKNTYKDFETEDLNRCRSKPVLPKSTIVSAGNFSSSTTNKMSYGPWEGYKRQDKILPKHHCLMGVGPMQEMTTARHDYTAKYAEQPNAVKPPGCLGLSDKPMEQRTTANMSYNWPDKYEPTPSFKPEKRYISPMQKMADETTQKLSYQPWDRAPREVNLWQQKLKYKAPDVPMHSETIYNNSFFAPGRFEEQPNPQGCYCATVGECYDSEGNPPKAHEYSTCPIGYLPNKDKAAQAVS